MYAQFLMMFNVGCMGYELHFSNIQVSVIYKILLLLYYVREGYFQLYDFHTQEINMMELWIEY